MGKIVRFLLSSLLSVLLLTVISQWDYVFSENGLGKLKKFMFLKCGLDSYKGGKPFEREVYMYI